MSESTANFAPTPEQIKEFQDLTTAVRDLAAYRSLLNQGLFPGAHSELIEKFRTFLNKMYDQAYSQYSKNPLGQ